LTQVCVTPGADCVSPCDASYCCPAAKKCLTPVSPGTISNGTCTDPQIFCPLTKLCVTAGADCTPP
jgi:hypothetical protein